jgi:diguanylate cyclase (GGDEF)-like protein
MVVIMFMFVGSWIHFILLVVRRPPMASDLDAVTIYRYCIVDNPETAVHSTAPWVLTRHSPPPSVTTNRALGVAAVSRRERMIMRFIKGPLLTVLIIAMVAVAFAVIAYVEDGVRERAVHQEILTAKIVISLSVDRDVSKESFASAELSSESRTDLDGDVAVLRSRGEIVGIEVWTRTGRLVYADAGHPADEVQLPDEELRRALSQGAFVQTNGDGERGVPLLEVFQPADPDGDGVPDGVVEVLLPLSTVDAASASSATKVRFGGVVAIALLGWALLAMRRRLRIRHHQAEHDPLTGLGNRTLLARRGETLVRAGGTQPDAAEPTGALLLIDLDGFKRVNDALGHAVGDDVLVAVAGRLRGVVREDQDVVRLGGDEFAILLVQPEDDDAGDRLADRIIAALLEPVTVGPVCVQIGASIGIAVRETDLDLGELLRRADVAMYQAKRRGGGYARYSASTDDNDADHLTLLGGVPRAIADNELLLNYQPKIGPGGNLTGVEALVRWQHPTRGLLAPDDFLPLVEETALMKPLTVWVLQHATAQVAAWRDGGLDVPIAVNVSPRTLIDPEFVSLVDAALSANGLPGTSLTIEITETAILDDPDGARLVIQQLRARDVGVSIDDFGTGFTSLAHLKQLPISEIKIDQAFVAGLVDSGIDHSIVAYTIRLAHDLGIPVVAEGVETAAALDELRALGCDEFQGFLIARPLGADDFGDWARPTVNLGHRGNLSNP